MLYVAYRTSILFQSCHNIIADAVGMIVGLFKSYNGFRTTINTIQCKLLTLCFVNYWLLQ